MAAKKQTFWAGFDLGGTKMQACVYSSTWRMAGVAREKTKGIKGGSASEGVGQMIKTMQMAVEDSGVPWSQIGAIGVGCPGPLDFERGVLIEAPNLGWKNVPLKALLEKKFKRPVILLNDVDAGIYGEFVAGAAVGARCALGVFPGTGLGGGCVYRGELFQAARSSCMEIGHMAVQPDGPLCGCGRRGCLEALTSRLAVAAACATAVQRGQAPKLQELAGANLSKMRSGTLREAVLKGDRVVEEIVARAAAVLGDGIGSLVNILAPDVVVLGGGLVTAFRALYLREVTTHARAAAMATFRRSFKVCIAKLGDDAGSLGAAAWARHVVAERRGK